MVERREDFMRQTNNKTKSLCYIVDKDGLPENYPTHKHEPEFWECLGRTVATFGFLEETLSRAIFAFTATRPYPEDEIDKAYEKWLPLLERTISDPLGSLIYTFGKSVREHPGSTITNLDEFLNNLLEASKLRNVLCHGSWRVPDSGGTSVPFFINRQKEIFETAVDCQFLKKVQIHTAELSCEVINTVIHMGLQFPGSNGPGTPIVDGNDI